MRRNKAAIAAWFVVIEYRLCRHRHNAEMQSVFSPAARRPTARLSAGF
jgi:hypothetical protein